MVATAPDSRAAALLVVALALFLLLWLLSGIGLFTGGAARLFVSPGGGLYPDFVPLSVDWSSIDTDIAVEERKKMPRKWMVVTSVNPPTEAIRGMLAAGKTGWQLVVVGDTKSPPVWKAGNAVYLSVEEQATLGYRIHALTPYRSYSRKNVGYLYAIQHGAQVVYDTDDDNILLMPGIPGLGFSVPGENKDSNKPLLLYDNTNTSRSVVNPYVHFGQPTMWPRGLPLAAVADNEAESQYVGGVPLRPLIQQGVANGDPDVDAIFRLTRVSRHHLIRVNFDSDAPPVALPPGLLAPCNSQTALFLRDALWALRIPITTAFRVCDIWRGYWAQRLLWDIGGQLAFYPPTVRQDRNLHDYYLDYLDEKDVYDDAERLVAFLRDWQSSKPHFFDRALDLANDMVLQGFWGPKDAEVTAAWLTDLIRVGYAPPQLSNTSLDYSRAEVAHFVPKSLPTSTLLTP